MISLWEIVADYFRVLPFVLSISLYKVTPGYLRICNGEAELYEGRSSIAADSGER